MTLGMRDSTPVRAVVGIDTGYCSSSSTCIYDGDTNPNYGSTPPALYWYYVDTTLSDVSGQVVIGSGSPAFVAFTDYSNALYFAEVCTLSGSASPSNPACE